MKGGMSKNKTDKGEKIFPLAIKGGNI